MKCHRHFFICVGKGGNIMKNNYFYKSDSEQFAFYRIPKLLFTDSRYAGISVEAKVLYGLLLDRMSLSIRNNWVDDDNRVYIYFTLEEITEYLSIGKDKGVKLLKELDGILIERKKQGLGKPVMIYVLNFTDNQNSGQSVDNSAEVLNSDVDNSIENADLDGSNAKVRTSEKPKSGENAEVLTSEIPKSALLYYLLVLYSIYMGYAIYFYKYSCKLMHISIYGDKNIPLF